MEDVKEVRTKINVIEALLAFSGRFPEKTPEERLKALGERFPDNDYLFAYYEFSKQELKDQLKLLREEKLKLMGSSTGNHIVLF